MSNCVALLDTSVIVDVLRNYSPAVHWLGSRQKDILGITPHVWMEVVSGVETKAMAARVMKRLTDFEMVYPTDSDMDWGMLQLSRFHFSHNVGVLDCLIAAPAHRLQLPLYTTNLKHFTPLLGALAVRPY